MSEQEIEQKIIDNEKLVYFVINRHFSDFRNDDDIVQCGRIGLWQACKRYDDEKSKFSTYAVKCIFNEILEEIRNRNKGFGKCYVTSLDEVIGSEDDGSDITVGHLIPSVEPGYCIVDHNLSSVERKLSDRDVEVFRLYIYGYRASEIS